MNVFRVTDVIQKIPLGRQGENLAKRIQFNLSSWKMEFGEGVPALIHKRAGDSVAYPVPLKIEGAAAYWDVTCADTENPGNGKCELAYYVDDVIVKSAIYQTVVQASMNDEVGFEPQDVPNWVDTVNAAIANANTAIEAANAATKAAQKAAEAANKAAENAGSAGGGTGDVPSDLVADDEEVDSMLDEIFGANSEEEGASSDDNTETP